MFTIQEEFELKVFNAIEGIMTQLLLKAVGQFTSKEAKRQIQENLKEIYQSNKRLEKAKCPLTEATIKEMIDAIPSDLLSTIYEEYLTGSEEDRLQIMEEVEKNLDQSQQETFETVTSHLKKKGFLKNKKAKGFGKKS